MGWASAALPDPACNCLESGVPGAGIALRSACCSPDGNGAAVLPPCPALLPADDLVQQLLGHDSSMQQQAVAMDDPLHVFQEFASH